MDAAFDLDRASERRRAFSLNEYTIVDSPNYLIQPGAK